MKKLITIFLVCLFTGLFFCSAPLIAANSIFLNEREKELIDRGEIIVREIDAGNKNGRTFEALGVINAPQAQVLQALTDYGKYPEFMPNVSHIEILKQNRNEAVLNYTLTLPLGKIKKYRLRIYITKPDRQTSKIQWQYLIWPGLKMEESIIDTSGYWFIEELSKSSSLVLYHVYTDPGPIPFGLGWIVDVLSKNSVPEALLQTKLRTEQIYSLKIQSGNVEIGTKP